MPPKTYPEAEDRSDAAVEKNEATVINLDIERQKRSRSTVDTNANNDPDATEDQGGGAQNDPI